MTKRIKIFCENTFSNFYCVVVYVIDVAVLLKINWFLNIFIDASLFDVVILYFIVCMTFVIKYFRIFAIYLLMFIVCLKFIDNENHGCERKSVLRRRL